MPKNIKRKRRVPTIPEAVKVLRTRLGDTQQQFAQRLEVAISTAVRYESTRAPQKQALAKLYSLAVGNRMYDVADMFRAAMLGQVGAEASQRLTDIEIGLELMEHDLEYGLIDQAKERRARLLKIVREMNPYSRAPRKTSEKEGDE
jgi:transcriptional regulator with XRE-family HTH domain